MFFFRCLRKFRIAFLMRPGLIFFFFVGCGNQPPSPPIVFGPQRARPEDTVMFSLLSVDREGDSISYYLEWSGGAESGWTEWLPPGIEYYHRTVFRDSGMFFLQVKARDAGRESDWSDTFAVDVRFWKPVVPQPPSGPDTVFVGDTVTFVSFGLHPLEESVALQFHWGDTLGEWGNFLPPGTRVWRKHCFLIPGVYEVRCRAKDRQGFISEWSLPKTVVVEGVRCGEKGGLLL